MGFGQGALEVLVIHQTPLREQKGAGIPPLFLGRSPALKKVSGLIPVFAYGHRLTMLAQDEQPE